MVSVPGASRGYGSDPGARKWAWPAAPEEDLGTARHAPEPASAPPIKPAFSKDRLLGPALSGAACRLPMMTHPVLVAAIRAKVSQAASTAEWPPCDKSSTIVRRFGMAGNPVVHRPRAQGAESLGL